MSCVALNHKQPVNQALKRRREALSFCSFKDGSGQVDNTATFSKTGVAPEPILQVAACLFRLAHVTWIILVIIQVQIRPRPIQRVE